MRVGGTTEYEYDTCGRITSVKENNKLSTYQYDMIGQLIRENNKHLDKTFIYSYNEIGNITSVKTYAYAEAGTTPTGSYTTKSYTYDGTNKITRGSYESLLSSHKQWRNFLYFD